MIFKFLFACIIYTMIARWSYKEVSLIFPDAVPFLQSAATKIQIPTHNRWSKKAVKKYIADAAAYLEEAQDAVEDIKEYVSDDREVMRRG